MKRRFTTEQCALIEQDWAVGVPVSEIARKLGRSEESLERKVYGLGLILRQGCEREFDKRMYECHVTLDAIERGSMDHLVADEATKAQMVEDLHAEMEAAILKFVRANPGQFYETPDGKIGAMQEGANTTPPHRPEEP